MPKSRKRKGAKKYRPPERAGQNAAPEEAEEPPSTVNVIRRLTTIFPLIAGAWLGGGFELRNPGMFVVVFAIAGAVHFFLVERIRRKLAPETVKAVFIRETLVFCEMLIFPILGALSQLDEIHFRLAIIGYVPACFLAAAAVAESAGAFANEGWKRSFEKTLKNGETVRRPGGLTRLFTLLLIAGPFLPIVLAPLGEVPTTMLLTVLPLYFMAPLASGFFEELQSEEQIAVMCERLAGAAALLVFFGGLLAQY